MLLTSGVARLLFGAGVQRHFCIKRLTSQKNVMLFSSMFNFLAFSSIAYTTYHHKKKTIQRFCANPMTDPRQNRGSDASPVPSWLRQCCQHLIIINLREVNYDFFTKGHLAQNLCQNTNKLLFNIGQVL